MSARILPIALLAASCAPLPPAVVASPAPASEFLSQCQGKDGWNDPAPPIRIHADTYDVGTCGISALLITSPAGHVLIDAVTPRAAPLVAANIERLGFRLRDVRWILGSHEHVDHAGGIAALKAMTGARVAARALALATLTSGKTGPADPQSGAIDDFPGVAVDRVIADGDAIRVGPLAITAHATPGHTAGGTSWSWRSCEAGRCLTVVFADSLTAVSRDGYRFTDHPALVATFRSSFARVAALECDLLVTPHPAASSLFERLAGKQPLIDRTACAAYARRAGERLDERLAKEAAK